MNEAIFVVAAVGIAVSAGARIGIALWAAMLAVIVPPSFTEFASSFSLHDQVDNHPAALGVLATVALVEVVLDAFAPQATKALGVVRLAGAAAIGYFVGQFEGATPLAIATAVAAVGLALLGAFVALRLMT